MLSKWPKSLPELTPEQIIISNDFLEYWHNVLPTSYNIVENFNHFYPVRTISKEFITTLEVGAGLGEHLRYENLSEHQTLNYTALELRSNMADKISEKHPGVRTLVGDIQAENLLPTKHFDRVLAIHVLEHLPDLPKALAEMHRCIKNSGTLLLKKY